MNAVEIVSQLESLGVQLVAAGESLHFRPASCVPEPLLEQLKSCKAEVLELVELRHWPQESRDCVRRFGHPHARLYPFLGRTVETPQGPGRLVQVFSDRAAVVLDGDPAGLTFLLPAEIRPPGAPAPRELGPAGPVQ